MTPSFNGHGEDEAKNPARPIPEKQPACKKRSWFSHSNADDLYKQVFRRLYTKSSNEQDKEEAALDILIATWQANEAMEARNESVENPIALAQYISRQRAPRILARLAQRSSRARLVDRSGQERNIEEFFIQKLIAERSTLLHREKVATSELLDEIDQLIEKMPPKHQIVVLAYFYEELTLQEIASREGMKLNTVKTIFRRVIQRMRLNFPDACCREEICASKGRCPE